tara:strand:+ start:1086 stop:2417 length:1332 start_codon:yes stop_codon:yes gene_type:complete
MLSKVSEILDLTNLIKLSKKNKLHINILFISVLLLPFSLVAGPLIMEILIFIIIVSFIYSLTLRSRKTKFSFNTLELLIVGLYFFLVISSLLSEYKLISLKSSLLSIRFIILVYAIIFLLTKLNYFLKYFLISSSLCFALTVFDGYVQFFFGRDIFFIPIEPWGVTGFFGEEKKLGSFLVRFFPIIIGCYLLISKEKIKKKIINIILIFIPFYGLCFLTSERMSLIYASLTLFFIMIYFSKFNKKVFLFFPLIFLIIPILFYYLNIVEFKLRVNDSYNQIFRPNHMHGMVFFSVHHELLSKTSIELFKKKPILGIGPNNFRRKCNSIDPIDVGYEHTELLEFQLKEPVTCSTHPHNIFFQLLAETGLIGIVCYLIFIFFIFKETFKFIFKKKYQSINIFFLCPLIYYLNPFFPSGNFFNNWYMFMGIIGLPFYLYLTKMKKSA